MSNQIISSIEEKQIKSISEQRTIPLFDSGDTVRVDLKVLEDTRERIQQFEGVCIAKKNRGINSSFTLRKIASGEGVERVFQSYSPVIVNIRVVKRGSVRRAKLYYLRKLTGKSARIAEKTTGYKAKLSRKIRS